MTRGSCGNSEDHRTEWVIEEDWLFSPEAMSPMKYRASRGCNGTHRERRVLLVTDEAAELFGRVYRGKSAITSLQMMQLAIGFQQGSDQVWTADQSAPDTSQPYPLDFTDDRNER